MMKKHFVTFQDVVSACRAMRTCTWRNPFQDVVS